MYSHIVYVLRQQKSSLASIQKVTCITLVQSLAGWQMENSLPRPVAAPRGEEGKQSANLEFLTVKCRDFYLPGEVTTHLKAAFLC